MIKFFRAMFFIGAAGTVVFLAKENYNMVVGFVLISMNGALPDVIKRSIRK